jgi:anti-sigma regulatory factor (Ser/Thr protein kinase)
MPKVLDNHGSLPVCDDDPGKAPLATPQPAGRPAKRGAPGGGINPVVNTARLPGKSAAPVPVPPLQQQGTGIVGEWPLRDFIELGALPGAVPCARLHARQLIWEWGITGLSESAELLVSELVTNAVQASRAMQRITPVRLWLLTDKARVLILVWDASPRAPERVHVSGDAESGRGLLLVETISDKWGWYFPQGTAGKVVWAEIR